MWPLALLLVSQAPVKCQGESYAELAARAYGDAQYGAIVAIFNRERGKDTCEKKVVRFPVAIRHQLRLGQPLEAVANRFCRAPGAQAVIREKNGLPADVEPAPNTSLIVPAEIAVELGTNPEQELSAIPGLPDLGMIRRYNAIEEGEALVAGGTVFVPLFLEAADRPPPPPPPPPEDVAVETPTSTKTAALRPIPVSAIATRDAFSHPSHAELLGADYACALCHTDDQTDTMMCLSCHSMFGDDSGLRPNQLPLTFSHDLHLDENRTVVSEGYTMDCDRCHALDDAGQTRARPGHTECRKCHNASEAKPTVATDCSGCHGVEEETDRLLLGIALLAEHYRSSPRGTDIRFGHEAHAHEPCERCHAGAADAETVDVLEPMRMTDCLECHRGLERELDGQTESLGRCRTCHVQSRPELTPSLSRVFDKPTSHTRAFRVRHGREASRDQGDCAVCHAELAGDVGARCDRCHNQIRPMDHSVRWREEPHGRAAVRNPDKCAACHQRDRCASCHAVAPRDHTPRGAFLLRHGISARTSIRRCQTCHVPQTDCSRCHDVTR